MNDSESIIDLVVFRAELKFHIIQIVFRMSSSDSGEVTDMMMLSKMR